MAGPEQQNGFAAEVVGAHRRAPRPGMRGRQHHHEFLAVQRRDVHAGFAKRQRQNDRVQSALLQAHAQIGGETLLHDERHAGRALAQNRNQVRQQIGADGVDHAEAQRLAQRVGAAVFAAPELPRDAPDFVGRFQHHLRLRDYLFAERGRRDPPGAALKQRHAELALQFFYRDAEGRLADKACFRGAPEMQFARDRDYVAQLVEGDARHRPAPTCSVARAQWRASKSAASDFAIAAGSAPLAWV